MTPLLPSVGAYKVSALLPSEVVYKLTPLLPSLGHRVKIHTKTAAVGNEGGDMEMKDEVVFARRQHRHLPPPPVILDLTITHHRFHWVET